MAISAGIPRGRKSRGSQGIKDDLLNAGAAWVDEPASVKPKPAEPTRKC